MGVSLRFEAAGAAVEARPAEVVVVAHGPGALDCPSAQLEAALAPGALDVLRQLAGAGAKPGKEAGASAESLVRDGEAGWQRVALCLLPSRAPSRHAAPGHPHELTRLVRSSATGDKVSVFLILAEPATTTFAACMAVARAFPLYSHKSKAAADRAVTVYTGAQDAVFTSEPFGAVSHADLEPLAAGVREAARLVDCPPNVLDVDAYVARALEWAGKLPNVTSKVIRGEELREAGLGGIYGVGQASVCPPALVILSHNAGPGSAAAQADSVCIVGKGIVYDTGGLSIKTKTGMPGMKRDMGGSAGVLGAFYSIVSTGGLPNGRPLHALLCIAENSVASNATRPDDIHVLFSGKTVEINNTDAEGRLVLADGLAYAVKHLNPAALVNMATLTGAQSSATGTKHAAIFSNSDVFEDIVLSAGRASGDLAHPLPYVPEFFRSEFKSAVADMKNSQKNRANCGSAAPATFLSNHIEPYLEKGKPWMHIDMAAPAFSGERATGFGVALLFLSARAAASKL
mmetsp:Transcript_25590/g.72432  ORF Transcript_25590/g.72432 Transcript_25590/m.72432 type:complete len:515 (-) Transcript_25590:138-1682(-)